MKKKTVLKDVGVLLIVAVMVLSTVFVTGAKNLNDPPYTPTNPSPSNHATGLDINADLSWTGEDPVEVFDQEQTEWNDQGSLYGDEEKVAQSFKPTIKTITRVVVLLEQTENPVGTIVLSIRETLDGEHLTESSMSLEELNEDVKKWYIFDFPDISVIPEQTYYIAIELEDFSGEGWIWIYRYIYDRDASEEDPYTRGELWWYGMYNGQMQWYNLFYINGHRADMAFRLLGLDEPPATPSITGATSGKPGLQYEYKIKTTDPEEHEIYYDIDWGDDSGEDNLGPYISGEEIILDHWWENEGTYDIMVMARDTHGAESDWATLSVTMPKTKPYINTPFLNFLENFLEGFPNAFPILRLLLGL